VQAYSNTWHELAWRLLKYKPNAAQREITEAWFGSDLRFLLICGGERAGKSLTSVALLLPLLMVEGVENPAFWIVGPDYRQARAEFEYIHKALVGKGSESSLVAEASMPQSGSQPWSMKTKWGATIETRTSNEVQKLASFTVHGFLMVEAAQQLEDVWLKLRGRVAETRGWGILSGTLEDGLPWYADRLRRWKGPNEEFGKSFSLPTWSNTDIFPGGREDEEIKALEAGSNEEYFLQHYGAEPQGYHGAVLKEFSFDRHVKPLEMAEGWPVEVWIDPGRKVYSVNFVQYIPPVAYVLDRIYDRTAIDHDVVDQAIAHPLFKFVPKVKDGHRGGVIDIAGKTMGMGSRSQVQLWNDRAGVSMGHYYVFENDTIEILRAHLKGHWVEAREGEEKGHWEPHLFFNSHMKNLRTPAGEALDVLAEPELWRYPKRSFSQSEAVKPIDSNNHAMKAIAYGLNLHTGFSLKKHERQRQQKGTIRGYV
jgi:hypothetical protein